MKKLNGNSVLLIDTDKAFINKLSSCLTSLDAQNTSVCTLEEAKSFLIKYDYDLVLCSYYLADGIIHQLVDWCRNNLEMMPVFIVLADMQPMDKSLMRHYSISGHIRKKENIEELINDLLPYFFDFEKFYHGVCDMIEPKGLKFEMVIDNKNLNINGIEVLPKGILIDPGAPLEINSQGLLRITLFEGSIIDNFLFSGFVDMAYGEGSLFRIYPAYGGSWEKFLDKIAKKQININVFMKKASGL